MVYENQLIGRILCQHQACYGILGGIQLNPRPLEQAPDDGEVHGGVVNDKNPCVGCLKALPVAFRLGAEGADRFFPASDRLPVPDFLQDDEGKIRTLPVFAPYFQLRSHLHQQPVYDVHAQARSLDVPVAAFFYPLKGPVQPFQVLRLYADAAVRNPEAEAYVAFVMPLAGDGKLCKALFRVFNRICQDIHGALLYPRLIAGEQVRHGHVDVNEEGKALRRCTAFGHVRDVRNRLAQVVGSRDYVHLARFYL